MSQLIDLRRERARPSRSSSTRSAPTDASINNKDEPASDGACRQGRERRQQLGDAKFSDLFIRSQQVALQEPAVRWRQ